MNYHPLFIYLFLLFWDMACTSAQMHWTQDSPIVDNLIVERCKILILKVFVKNMVIEDAN